MEDPAVAMAHASALRSIARVVEEKVDPTPADVAKARITEQVARGKVLVLSGAGVSTDSGIPDYRGPRGSLSRHRPMTYQEFRHDPAALHRYWARSFVGWRHMDAAAPNRVHELFAKWEVNGLVSGVVTQNVDGLHQAAGSRNVVALHGDLATVVCLNCGRREDRHSFDARLEAANPGYLESIRVEVDMVNPDGDVTLNESDVSRFNLLGCLSCGSPLLKPDVVYFGEPVPAARKAQVAELLERSQSVLVAGSSLAVMSGMRIVLDAIKQGKEVAVINGGPGRADDRVGTVWRTQLRPALEAIDAQL
ncbi:Sir2 family NAD-dependent protein deacetylase [Corynebacterium kozikiae]|uniref:Sir2 family NAD-dependent protein deacetylase n=1 Tax=Corynebacterium kozikiae TaxID=2968469 RepID=UPI00211C54F2|nr:Sir2 family NAD-dependent protein deacetylase [Corynebacterium sp. 76QC2CO]MCQ9343491.1 NAD-dependent protein deacetylase [Corynebacterium sp. 76QC2CO]